MAVLLERVNSITMQPMKKPLFTKFLCAMLVMVLAIGQGPLGVAMAAPVANSADQASMPMDMAGMDMSASTQQTSKDCCDTSDSSKAMKAAMCSACCATAAQTAMMPFQASAPVQYAVAQSYELTDTVAISKSSPPDLPPPKA
jgi:hypothetical protein